MHYSRRQEDDTYRFNTCIHDKEGCKKASFQNEWKEGLGL